MRRAAQLAGRALHQAASIPALKATCSPCALLPELGAAQSLTFSGRGLHSSAPSAYPTHIEDEPFCRQRQLIVLGSRIPELSPGVWVAPNAVVVGDVDLFDGVNIWYGCVLRGDLNNIRVGHFTNVQDKTIIHAARSSPTGLSAATSIGQNVSIGQGCLLRSVTIGNEVVVGDKCILLEGSMVEDNSVLAAGSLLPPGALIPSGQLWAGKPARFVRDLSKDEKAAIPEVARGLNKAIDEHSAEFLPTSFAYLEAEKLREKLQAPSP